MASSHTHLNKGFTMNTATFGLVITFTAHPGMRDALVAHLVAAGQSYASETGTQQFVVATSPSAPDTVIVIERYADHAAHAKHEAALGYAAIRAKTGEFLAGPPQVLPLQIAGGKL
jgi:quinol monooxygenase YgiN